MKNSKMKNSKMKNRKTKITKLSKHKKNITKHNILYIRHNQNSKIQNNHQNSHQNSKNKNKTSNKKAQIVAHPHFQSGGEFLGSGGFAICVVTPPLKCSERPDLAKYMNGKYISKLVEYRESRSSSIEMEVKHGETVMKIDPQGKYFAPVISSCYFTPQKHQDVVYKRRNKMSSTEVYYSTTSDNKIKTSSNSTEHNSDKYYDYVSYSPSNKCTIHKDKIYMNLILRNAGKSIKKVFSSGTSSNLTYMFIKNNVKKVMYHLCHGLMLLHNNHISHKDIKMDNITIKYNVKGKKARLNFIDFGLSETLFSREYTEYEYQEILGGGTLVYTPPDIRLLLVLIRKLIKHDQKAIDDPLGHLRKVVMSDDKIRRFDKHAISQFQSLGLKKGGIVIEDKTEVPNAKDNSKFYTEAERNKIYDLLLSDIHKGRLEKNYFEPFGYFYKWDVYSLGLVFTKFVKKYGIIEPKCIDLINNMINLNYRKRFTIIQCLKHEFFKGINETEFVEIYENYPIVKEQLKGLHLLEDKIKKHHK